MSDEHLVGHHYKQYFGRISGNRVQKNDWIFESKIKKIRDKDFIENNTWQPRAELRTVKISVMKIT